MQNQPVLESHYGTDVWTNRDMDAVRRQECLCYNCGNLDFQKPDSQNCPMASTLYGFCRTTNLAIMITRCPAFKPKEEKTSE